MKAKNKAQRNNKVASARGMDIDPQPVPMIKGSAKALKKKKVKAKSPVKVRVAEARARLKGKAASKAGKGGKAAAAKPTLATMLQKPVGPAAKTAPAVGVRAAPAAKLPSNNLLSRR